MSETTATRDVLLDIRARRGVLNPATIVDESRAPEAPLHSRFEWDDTVAGEAYRQVQAAQIIRSVHITLVDEPGRPPTRVRAFLPIPLAADEEDGPETSYEPTEEIGLDPVRREIVQARMEREWRLMRRRYETHKSFWAMVRADIEREAS